MNDAAEIVDALKAVVATKSLSSDEVNDLLKEGIKAGLGRIYGPTVQAEISINDQSGGVDILVLRRVVEDVQDSSIEISLDEARWDDEGFEIGDVMEIPVEFSEFGRNAVMAVKQKIVQLVRENERDRIRYEFEDKIGQLVTGEVQQIESGKIIILINGVPDADALIPWKEQNPRERFRQGDPIRSVLRKVEETPKGPRLILSRGSPLFVGALFKLEVPEIQQGIIEIKEIAREVGGRTKLAVYSHDESIDPVGSCVGLRGSRVQAVVQELGGERIDIVPWHAEPEVFARRSLAPARVSKIMSDPVRRVITAIVNEDQLSLAIGRNGQNVRLASQLIGWQVDLYGSREWIELGADLGLFEREAGEDDYESSDFALEELDLPRETLATLQNSGYSTFLQIIDFSKEDFVKIEGISEAESERLMELIEELTVLDGAAASETEEVSQPDGAVVSETEEVSQSDGAVVSETEESDKVEE